ncbi:hypothetical protein C8R44DRAFT_750622 [Mycena epipterygia]|nr:hypothetical protein C8R44DRAFT_750622 [Mycena epipterygia]
MQMNPNSIIEWLSKSLAKELVLSQNLIHSGIVIKACRCPDRMLVYSSGTKTRMCDDVALSARRRHTPTSERRAPPANFGTDARWRRFEAVVHASAASQLRNGGYALAPQPSSGTRTRTHAGVVLKQWCTQVPPANFGAEGTRWHLNRLLVRGPGCALAWLCNGGARGHRQPTPERRVRAGPARNPGNSLCRASLGGTTSDAGSLAHTRKKVVLGVFGTVVTAAAAEGHGCAR